MFFFGSQVRFNVENPKDKAALDDAVERHGLDVWAEVPGRHTTARIPPLVLVETFGVPHKVLNKDLESALIEERQSTKTGQNTLICLHKFSLSLLASQIPNTLCRWFPQQVQHG